MPENGRKFETCADIAREAEAMLEKGEAAAARILLNRVAETCVFGPRPCPMNSECQEVIVRVAHRLGPER